MTGELEYSLPPAIRRISGSFRWYGWTSFWIQVFLGGFACVALLLGSLGQIFRTENNGLGTGGGLFLSTCGIVALFLSAYWAFRYTRVARRLRGRDESRRPKPKDAIRVLKFGLYISLSGTLLTLLAAQMAIGSIILRASNQPQTAGAFGVPRNVSQFVTEADFWMVQANTNILFAHFLALIFTLWILNTINRA